MAAAHSSMMACPGSTNNILLTIGLLGRTSIVSMANARCTVLRSSSSSTCRRRSSTSTSPLLSKKMVRLNTNFSPRSSRLSAMGALSPLDLKLLNVGTSSRGAVCRAGMDSAPERVTDQKPSQTVVVLPTFQQAIQRLQNYWTSVGCAVMQSSDTERFNLESELYHLNIILHHPIIRYAAHEPERCVISEQFIVTNVYLIDSSEVGAGITNQATFLRVLGPEPWNVVYVEPSVRPDDCLYGDKPNRVQKHSLFQVILKPDLGNVQDLYLGSLAAIGIDIKAHGVRFVESNWESPVLSAWGLGREVWMDGTEITQFTYFQQAESVALVPVFVEITYDLERILMSLQEDKGREEHAGKVLNLQPHDLDAVFDEGISSEVNCRLTLEQADPARVCTLSPSNDGRAEELAKVVEIMRQSLVSVLELLEALVRQKETTVGSSKSTHPREVMSDPTIASALTAVETIGPSVNGVRIEREKDLKSPSSRMDFRKNVQKKEANRSLNSNVNTAPMIEIREEDEKFMGEALLEAKKAAMAGEVPVGAVIVQKGKIIARAYNRVESDADPTAHAEMLCLRSAARHHGDWRLMDATLYVTLEPCPMCAGAILQSRVKGLVWGSRNTLLGADGSWVSLFPELVEEEMDSERQKSENEPRNRPSTHPFHTRLEVRRQVLADECSTVMRSFFKARRQLRTHILKTKPSWLPLSTWMLFKRVLTWWSSSVKE